MLPPVAFDRGRRPCLHVLRGRRRTMTISDVAPGGKATAGGSERHDGPILELRNLEKHYGPVLALKPATLAFNYDEIHAIVGENGAGKSTLIKLLTGVIRRTGGEIFWNGAPVGLDTPQEAIDHGINAVHQEVVLCRHLSVAANIFLGDERVKWGLMEKRRMTREAQKVLADMGFNLPAGETL